MKTLFKMVAQFAIPLCSLLEENKKHLREKQMNEMKKIKNERRKVDSILVA